MMPDLGKYALEVSLAYVGSFAIIIAFVVASIAAHKRALKKLAVIEAEK